MPYSDQAPPLTPQLEISKYTQLRGESQESSLALEQRIAERTRELSVLYEVTAIASQAPDLETLLARSLERLMAAIHCEVGAIYLLDETKDTSKLRLVIQQGLPANLLPQLELLSADTGLAGWVMMQGEALLVPNLIAVPDNQGKTQPGELMNCVVAPLRASNRVKGILGLLRKPGLNFKVEEVALLGAIADQVGAAVESERLRQLGKQTAVLSERHAMARELHDSITQSLYSLSLLAEVGQAQLDAEDVAAAHATFIRISETTHQALKEMRLFIYRLRPPVLEQEGLVGALHQRLAAVEGRADVQARLLADELPNLPITTVEALYYVAQEALNNILHHARATVVTIYLRLNGEQLILEIVDNGCGFDLSTLKSGLGLTTMRERVEQLGGLLQITSEIGLGTTIKATVKLTSI